MIHWQQCVSKTAVVCVIGGNEAVVPLCRRWGPFIEALPKSLKATSNSFQCCMSCCFVIVAGLLMYFCETFETVWLIKLNNARSTYKICWENQQCCKLRIFKMAAIKVMKIATKQDHVLGVCQAHYQSTCIHSTSNWWSILPIARLST